MEVLLQFLLIFTSFLHYSWEDCSIRRVGNRLEIDVDANRYCENGFERQLQHEAEKVSQDERDILHELGEKFNKFRRELDDCQSSQGKLKQLYEEEKKKNQKQHEKIKKLENMIESLKKENEQQKRQLAEQEEKLTGTRTLLQRSMDFNEELKRNHSYLEDEFENCTDGFKVLARQNKVQKEEVRKWMRLAKILRKQLSVVLPTLNRCRNSHTTMFCGFEDDALCGFEENNSNTLSDIWWGRSNVAVLPSGLSLIDHTCGSERGYFLHIASSSPERGRYRGQKTFIASPYYFGVKSHCVSFFYYMVGYNVGTLNVYTHTKERGPTPKWSAYGNQGTFWTKANIDVPSELTRFGYKVIFETILDLGAFADIGIDDVRVAGGECGV